MVSGTLGQKVGWHYGFGCAGVVMVLGLIIYLSGRRWLPPDTRTSARSASRARSSGKDDWLCVLYLVILIPVMAISLLTNQEIFNAYLVWGDQQFNLQFMQYTMPSSWLITLDATLSFSMLVAVAAFWKWWSLKRPEPDEISKMIIGSLFTIAGGACLFIAAATQTAGAKIGLFWPFMFHLLNSIGFAHILPISLALFSKIAPRADQRDRDRALLPRLLHRQCRGRLCRRPLFEPADDHLLADPHRQRRLRPGRVRGLQAGAGQADERNRRARTGRRRAALRRVQGTTGSSTALAVAPPR